MNPDDLKDVEIVEPPIQELTKKNHWVGKACLSSCGFVIFMAVLLIVGLKMYIGQGPKESKNLPANFPRDIPIYDEYNVEKITVITGRYKSRSMEIAAFFPKIILSPLILSMDKQSGVGAGSAERSEETSFLSKIWRLLARPVSDKSDTVQVEWYDVQSEPKSMISYYRSKLEDSGFSLNSESDGPNFNHFTFVRGDGYSGSVYVEHGPDNKNKINYAFLMVDIPAVPSTTPQTTTTQK